MRFSRSEGLSLWFVIRMSSSVWRTLLVLWLVGVAGADPAGAQQWSGTTALSLSGGYQTNTYLDPVTGIWDPTFDPAAYTALTPQVGLVRDARRTDLTFTARTRLYSGRPDRPQFVQGYAQFRYQLSPSWSLGTGAGATRHRLPTTRDTWWALPSLRWTPTSETMLSVRAGATQRVERSSTPTRQTSGLGTVRATHWLTDRVRGGLRLYYTDGRASAIDAGVSGTGARLSTTYWPSGSLSLTAHVGTERLRYDTTPGPARSRIDRAGIEAEWSAASSVTVVGRARALRQPSTSDLDVHASLGVRIRVEQVLGGTAPAPLQRRVCRSVDGGVTFSVPYSGNGRPHLTGEFTNWSLPGLPMTESDDGRWTATVDLPPGQYAYRVRVLDGDDARWLSLPSYARTTSDAFGGTNGVCTVP